MKKLIFILFTLSNIIVNAQVRNYKNGTKTDIQVANENLKDNSKSNSKKESRTNNDLNSSSRTNFGILGGINFSNEQAVVGELNNPTSRTGFHVGLAFKTQFSNFVGLGSHVVYSNMGANFNSDLKDELDYVQLPIFITLGGDVFKAKIGPQIGYLISANFDGLDYIDTLNSFDFGSYVGFEILIPNSKIGITGSYYQGFTNINKDRSDLEIWNKAYSVGLIFYFK
jgi:hypothetical protein